MLSGASRRAPSPKRPALSPGGCSDRPPWPMPASRDAAAAPAGRCRPRGAPPTFSAPPRCRGSANSLVPPCFLGSSSSCVDWGGVRDTAAREFEAGTGAGLALGGFEAGELALGLPAAAGRRRRGAVALDPGGEGLDRLGATSSRLGDPGVQGIAGIGVRLVGSDASRGAQGWRRAVRGRRRGPPRCPAGRGRPRRPRARAAPSQAARAFRRAPWTRAAPASRAPRPGRRRTARAACAASEGPAPSDAGPRGAATRAGRAGVAEVLHLARTAPWRARSPRPCGARDGGREGRAGRVPARAPRSGERLGAGARADGGAADRRQGLAGQAAAHLLARSAALARGSPRRRRSRDRSPRKA